MEKYEDLLPKDAVPLIGFRIVSYINNQGAMSYKISSEGDGVAISHLIGLLEMAKHDICTHAVESAHKSERE